MREVGWQISIDRGGTFTDVVARAPGGQLHCRKLLSESPELYSDAAAEGVRRILVECGHPGDRIDEIRMGTTVATNALLERTGAPTALVINRGYGDVLEIGDQQRPEIFALHIRRTAPLHARVLEVAGRIDADGKELEPLDIAAAERGLTGLREAGIDSVAICLMHAWRSPAHELQLAAVARAAGFAHVSVSHDVSPLMKLVNRGTTTVADAYLSPVLRRYVDRFQADLAAHSIRFQRLLFMQSNGGLVSAEMFRGKDAVLSGPAGGVIGMGAAAERAGLSRQIGFDMGGTSTDVSLHPGEPEMADSCDVAGLRLVKPTLRVHTIAAGGGSILKYVAGRLAVGPESAGAQPGPMAYGRSGPLTITDANLMLGRIQARFFPAVFGPSADQPLDAGRVRRAFGDLAGRISADGQQTYSAEQTAEGFLRIAIDNMANAIRHISIQRGQNPADFTLCCFGGAAGQHACQLADRLGMQRILIDPLAGLLSAHGIGVAPLRSYRQRAINRTLDHDCLTDLADMRVLLERECRALLERQGVPGDAIRTEVWLDIKQRGSDTALPVAWVPGTSPVEDFHRQHRQRFGFAPTDSTIVVAAMRVEAAGSRESAAADGQPFADPNAAPAATGTVEIWLDGGWVRAPVCAREALEPGGQLHGPALVTEAHGTILLERDWTLAVNQARQLILERAAPLPTHASVGPIATADPVMLEIFNNQFMHIATQMGAVLEQTAHSVNIKERLDFSCALFDATGNLLANAPHMPVHLGSMDDSIRKLLAEQADELARGTCFAANAPYNGGTHLPDVTIVTPFLDATGDRILFIIAARAHHADIGGITPGSMPPHSRHIAEEGVVLDNVPVLRSGKFLESELRGQLAAGPWPARNPDQNIADLRAQLAANERGRQLLRELIERYGLDMVMNYSRHLLDNAEESVRSVIDRLHDGRFRYPLDNGQHIDVSISVDRVRRSARIDFSGTSAAADNNFNAPSAVCQAAVMYVFRTLVDIDIPLNTGCRRPLDIVLPAGCMLNPEYPAAVVGGNVETSQCVTDALFGALGVMAAAQGTMNNLSFGDDELQYYETICGGAGAGPDFPGASAVQTHMTNSRMTDPEVLESRFPVLVTEFSIRRSSGGRGKQPGGDGVIRKLEFRRRMHAAILSNHRVIAPFGLCGGEAGQPGRNRIIRASGMTEDYQGILATEMQAGDTIVIATPGGGGFGPPDAT
jgi:5-oxoprolinase (ATP-hydrolysing)